MSIELTYNLAGDNTHMQSLSFDGKHKYRYLISVFNVLLLLLFYLTRPWFLSEFNFPFPTTTRTISPSFNREVARILSIPHSNASKIGVSKSLFIPTNKQQRYVPLISLNLIFLI